MHMKFSFRTHRSLFARVLSAFLLGLYLPCAYLAVPGMALCIGQNDGHVALEFAPGGRCADSCNDKSSEAIEATKFPTDHCGVCIDIPFGGNLCAKAPREILIRADKTMPVTANLANPMPCPFSQDSKSHPVPSNPHPPGLFALRTVILRI